MKIIYGLISLLMLAGCNSQMPIAPTSPAELIIQHSPALRPLEAAIQSCSLALQPLPVIVKEIPPAEMNIPAADISLSALNPVDTEYPAYQIGTDTLIVVVHPDNSLDRLPLVTLQGIMQGFITRWEDVEGSGAKQYSGEITLLVYVPSSELQIATEARLNDGKPIGLNAIRFDHPDELMIIVSEQPGAIGLIPASLISESVKLLQVEGIQPALLSFPIIAQTQFKAEGNIAAFLHCLQQSTNK
ncbi:MAG: hypothetical protein C0391_08335 [Anaerolinea sp.]|nr:hypothetical protein [Anaerolinea sp.]